MSNVLKVKVTGHRIRYQVSKVTFNENDLLKANAWRWDCERNALYPNDNLDILRDYETFDCADVGVAIRTDGHIFYELGETKGNMQNHNVLSALRHPILTAIDDANEREGMTLVSADVFDEENTIYEYIVEVSDGVSFDETLLEIITVKDPITSEEYIVELRYDGKKMMGALDGLPFGEPMEDKSMFILNMPKDYADALGLGESRNILKFDDFIKEANTKVVKKRNKVKTAKDYNQAAKNGCVKLREDYIHSFIDEHERGVEPEEEE